MCKDLQTKTETFGKHSIEASTPLPAEKQLCFTVGQFPMFSFSVQTRDFLSSMATTLHLLKEAVPIISRAEWKILKWHCLLAPGFNLLMFSIPMVPVHSSTLLKSFASGDNSQVLHCPRRGSFSITGDKSFWRSHQPPAPPSKSCLCTIHRTRFLLFPTRQSSQFEDSPCHEDSPGLRWPRSSFYRFRSNLATVLEGKHSLDQCWSNSSKTQLSQAKSPQQGVLLHPLWAALAQVCVLLQGHRSSAVTGQKAFVLFWPISLPF